jgi:hypothetical protein
LTAVCQELEHLLADLVTHPAKNGHPFLFAAGSPGRILESDMGLRAMAQPHWAVLGSVVTYGYHDIKVAFPEFASGLGTVPKEVNVQL